MLNTKQASLPSSVYEAVEGMAHKFNPEEAKDLEATIQFNIASAAQEAKDHYVLSISGGSCDFSVGSIPGPSLTINTPADVWLKISRKELNGTLAFLTGRYSIKGNLRLLTRMDALFSLETAE